MSEQEKRQNKEIIRQSNDEKTLGRPENLSGQKRREP